jgi:hypothetical protein
MRERTLTVPTAAAKKKHKSIRSSASFLAANSQGRRGVKVVNVSGEIMVT